MNALLVGINRVRNGNLMARQKAKITVAPGASVRQPQVGDHGIRRTGCFHAVNGAVAGRAVGGVRVALARRLPVNALPKFLNFLCVAFRAFRWR